LNRILLDSTFLIDHLRGLPIAVARFRQLVEDGTDLILSDVAAAEIWSGGRADHPAIERLLTSLEFVQPGPETARLAGTWRAEARGRGATLSIADALIAASAFNLEAAVLTRNTRHFSLTPVRIETY
jgi:predicted nucleic acid-binding protein